jgi:phage head maturation protease
MAYNILNKDGKKRKRDNNEVLASDYLQVVKSVDMEKRTLKIIATDETKDRDGDIIEMKGWDIANYLKNPVFLWAHDYTSVPLAAAQKIVKRREPKQMAMTHKFPTEGLFPFSDMILNLYNEKMINAGSVGFIFFDYERIEEGDNDYSEDYHYGRRFKRQELLEHSGCAVPANPNAIQESMKQFGYDQDSKLYKYMQDVNLVDSKEIEEFVDKDFKNEIKELLHKGVEVEEETEVIVQVPDNIANDPEIFKWTYEEKPYKNEHACRLKNPADYEQFARKNCGQKHDGKCIDIIYGIKDGTSEIQALRYKKDIWTKSAAKSHCKSRSGLFEAAADSMEEYFREIEEKLGEDMLANIILYNNEDMKYYIYLDGEWVPFMDDKTTEVFNPFKQLETLFEEVMETYIAKSLGEQVEDYRKRFTTLLKVGAVLNKKNKARLTKVLKLVGEVLADAGVDLEDDSEEDTQASSASGQALREKRNDKKSKGLQVDDYFNEDHRRTIPPQKRVVKTENANTKKLIALTKEMEGIVKKARQAIG